MSLIYKKLCIFYTFLNFSIFTHYSSHIIRSIAKGRPGRAQVLPRLAMPCHLYRLQRLIYSNRAIKFSIKAVNTFLHFTQSSFTLYVNDNKLQNKVRSVNSFIHNLDHYLHVHHHHCFSNLRG